MKPDAFTLPPNPKKLKVIYGWYIYVIYILLVFNIYMAVYNVCVRYPIETPLLSLFHSVFLALMLQQVLKKHSVFAWILLSYFILMRLYYANVLHVEFTLVSRALVLLILTLLLTGAVAVGQLASPPQRHDWLARLGWRQWAVLTALAAILTPLITTDYLG
ncbi:hypothetical protein BHU62_20690 [Serratia marcescens]|uniref:Uncharacterized protein n=1 Tax=Serratia marcescens TaxID=615 RepID=A0A1Q4NVA4_SERMA|nr:hypothetical protein [Serratia marcescens]OKB64820.1 hypothetical protein BHU62_20690 [Serratia marcescens]